MAKLADGVSLVEDLVITDASVRSYDYRFDTGRTPELQVTINDVPVSSTVYSVTPNANFRGGTIRFLTSAEVTGAVELTAGERLKIKRDSTVTQPVSFGNQGYAESALVSTLVAAWFRVIQELASRVDTNIDLTLTQQEIQALIDVTTVSRLADGSVDMDALDSTVREAINDKVELGGISIDAGEHTITFIDGAGLVNTLNLPEGTAASWASAGNTDLVPDDKLPDSSATQAGIITAAQFTKLEDAVEASTLHDTPALTNDQLQGADALLLDDASVAAGSQLREILISELDKRWNTANEIEPIAAVPATDGYTVGDIINVSGSLYELVDDTDDSHIIRGTAGGYDNFYYGAGKGIPTRGNVGSFADPAYMGGIYWRVVNSDDLPRWEIWLKSSLLAAPPANIYAKFQDQRGEQIDIAIDRRSSLDKTGFVAYATSADGVVADTPIGDTFVMSFYSDDQFSVPLVVHEDDRWEKLAERTESTTSAPTRQEIFDLLRLILLAGGGTELTISLLTRTITVSEKPIGTGEILPNAPKIGDQFILLANEDIPTDPIRTTFQPQVTLRQVALNGGTGYPEALRGYPIAYSGPNAATRRGAVFLVYNGPRLKTANRVWYYSDGATPRSFLVQPNSPAGMPNEYLVTGLDYGTFAIGNHHINVGYTDGTKLNPDETQALGHLLYVGGSRGWIFYPGSAADWARQGKPRPHVTQAVTELDQGNTTPGLSIVNSSADARSGLHGFSPNFDLDDEDNRHGVLDVEATIAVSLASNTGIGFDTDSTNPLTSIRITAFAFANKLRAQAAYLDGVTDTIHGTLMGSVVVRLGGDTLGTARVYLAHDNDNVVGLGLVYDGSSGAHTFSLTVQDISAVFSHNDGPGDPVIQVPGDIFSGNVEVATAYEFVRQTETWPADRDWGMVAAGIGSGSTASKGYQIFSIKEIREGAFRPATGPWTTSNTTGHAITVGSFILYLGTNAAGEVLVSTSNADEDPMPLVIKSLPWGP